MEDARLKQLVLKGLIDRSLENFKKVGKNNLTPAKIRSRISTLTSTWQQFQDGHVSLTLLCPEETKPTMDYFKDGHFTQVEEVYTKTLDFMSDALEELEPPAHSSPSGLDFSLVRPVAAAPQISLPPIRLPPFDGNFEDWESFRDRFNTLVRDNKDLSGFTRMHYLVSSVSGSALECIKHLSITADNFTIAWDTLTSRFDNKRRLLTKLFNDFLSFPYVTRESADELRALLDKASSIIAALKTLGRDDVTLWDDMLGHVVSQRFDPATRKAWALRASEKGDLPSYKDVESFLAARVCALQEVAPPSSKTGSKVTTSRIHVTTASAPSGVNCPLCQGFHFIQNCSQYECLTPIERQEVLRRHKRCFNCLSNRHSVNECPSKFTCRTCHQRHHSSIHISSDAASRPQGSTSFTPSPAETSSSRAISSKQASVNLVISPRRSVLLATASVAVGVPDGRRVTARALIDQGSEITFITESVAQRLHAPRICKPTSVKAFGGTPAGTPRHAAHIVVSHPTRATPSFSTVALISKTLTAHIPKHRLDRLSLAHLSDLEWADSDPSSETNIDIIIGADLYGDIILDGIRKGQAGDPVAQNTIFGWVVSGPCEPRRDDPRDVSDNTHSVSVYHCLTSPSLEEELRRFWEVEETPSLTPLLAPDDALCEEHFRITHSRDSSGRYIVRLPFKSGHPVNIGETRRSATNLARNICRRLDLNPDLRKGYTDFMGEYVRLGHMRLADSLSAPPASSFIYIPHHPVLRPDSTTSHLRVVFNASCRSSNGTTLNDHLLTGPKLQSNLTAVILRWRQWQYVYSADIAKMYRQILVDTRDINYQRILWHPNLVFPFQEYQLLTVTYGMACAPFLALRVLQQLVLDEGQDFPTACDVLKNNIYVDDVLFGSDDSKSLQSMRDQLISLVKRGGFTLRKWASNTLDLLADIDASEHGLASNKILAEDESIKVLGLGWNPSRDEFNFTLSSISRKPATKRAILSVIARLYDPFGWVTPVIIKAKILMQDLWRSGVTWDSPVSDPLLREWTAISARLECLNSLTIPRWVQLSPRVHSIELHGFADASNCAYGAVVFLRIRNKDDRICVSLLIGKSKVAPLKPISVPRLELCAAVMLSRLIAFVADALQYKTIPVCCWSDSTVVLTWIAQHPSRWKMFVANRVATIQSLIPSAEWRYVPSADNPADCASRGLYADELLPHSLWWSGPSWLTLERDSWPPTPPHLPSDPCLEEKVILMQCATTSEKWELAERYSSWPKLIRVTAYVLRFVHRCQRHQHPTPLSSHSYLTADEFRVARTFWLKRIQADLFPSEIIMLSREKPFPAKHPLLALRPFLDPDNLIRVGGRLRQAPLPYNTRHPILLASHPLVLLLITHTHHRALHAGPQLTLGLLRRDFWVLRARGLVRRVIKQCIACTRERAAIPSQLMGDLPSVRVTPSARSFLHCGVDYAGPIHVRTSPGRGHASRKAYVALFICLASKAIHLELVSDYSTEAFIGAFTRFCARRGLPVSMYSDNGTTFVGADRELTKAYRSAIRDPNLLNSLASDCITWHFIPPSAPHFGGLWEAGVRSVKFHLSRVLGDRTLTFEELYTLLCRIEACLNSRPLAPLSDALSDYDYLTPGHFTIGSAITVNPEPSLLELNENRLSRWQLVRQMTERFWHIWQSDYINTLQQRTKWRIPAAPVCVGRLVLLRNPNLPPGKWELGRVLRCHPGSDGLTRVVTVKTAHGEYKRPIGKLCLLPVEESSANCAQP